MEGQSSKKFSAQSSKSRFKKAMNFFLNLFGKKTKKSFSTVISHLLDDYRAEGLINSEEQKMFNNMASFGDKRVATIMTPRADIIAIKQDATLEDVKKVIIAHGYTRIPVFKEDIDEIIGFIHSKDLAKFLCEEEQEFSVSKIMRKMLFVPGSMKLLDVLLRMRLSRVHVAIVLDEFGAADGFVTIENLMEEIVGDIEDEHDTPSDSAFFRIRKISDDHYQLGGRIEIQKVEELLGIKIKRDDNELQTIGGLAMSLFNKVPADGEELELQGLKFKIIDADARSIKLIEVINK